MESLLPDDSRAACLGCTYPLPGLTEPRCPECGREFDPDDPKTMYVGRVPDRLTWALIQPPGWLMHTAVVIWAALHLAAFSIPRTFFDLLAAGVVYGAAIAGLWLFRILEAFKYGTLSFKKPAIRRRWLTAPAIVAVTILLCWVQVPLYIGFWLSESAMNRTARQVMSLPKTPAYGPAGWIGLYPVYAPRRTEGGMVFFIREVSHLNLHACPGCGRSCGFAYSQDGPPPPEQGLEYVHFSGPWWLCLFARTSGGGNI
jgi:hypothetical protein